MKSIRLHLALLAFGGVSYAQPVITSVVDPYTGGAKLSPGGQALITGTNLGVNPLVTVGGINAFNLVPPQFGSTITIEVPVNAPLGANIPVIVSASGTGSAAFNVTLVQYAPVLIGLTSGALTSPRHQSSGVAVTTSTPAAPGENIVLYAIGLGATTPAVNTGQLAPQGTTQATTNTVPTVTIGTNSPVNAPARLANSQGFFGANYSGGETGSGQALIGVYLVSVTVPSGTAPGTYPISLTIAGATSNTLQLAVGPAPAGPVISAIVGESGKTALCPGDVAIISGVNLGTLPAVTFGGKTAYVLNAPNGGNQMTVEIPVDAPLGAINATVAPGSGPSSPAFPVTLTPTAPALVYGSNGGPFIPFHQGGAAVTNANPAAPGEMIGFVVYGLGLTNPVVPTGTLSPNSPASTVTATTVNVGGFTGLPATATLVSGQIGLYEINFVVPATATTGGFATSVTAGGITTGLVTVQVFSGPLISNVSNAASNIPGALPNGGIAQGSIFIVQGTNLGPANIVIAPTPFQNTTLSATSIAVTVSGTTVNALMYYTSAGQLAALLPSNTPTGSGIIVVTYNGAASLNAPISVVANNLGIFTIDSSGQGPGIVTYPDYSLVSAAKTPNCGGPNTTCGAANPGDVLIIWATGLGPVTGGDTAATAPGQVINAALTVWLGGVQAKVGFQGRGCCFGEDQIVITVPNNAPTGCAVPLIIQIGSETSNTTVMPVANGSRNCTPTSQGLTAAVQQQVLAGPLSFGSIKLQHQLQPGATYADDAKFQFFRIPSLNPGTQPFFLSWLDTLPLGTCGVIPSLNGNGPNLPISESTLIALDAGTNFTVKGPNGSIPVTGQPGQFDPTISQAGTFLVPGAYIVSGSGGADVGSFTANVTFPALPTLTSPSNGGSATRSSGLTATWTGGNGNVQFQVSGATDNSFSAGAQALCTAPSSAGSFTIPPYILQTLPAGANAGLVFQPASSEAPFTATGLNLGIIQTESDGIGFGYGAGTGSFTLN